MQVDARALAVPTGNTNAETSRDVATILYVDDEPALQRAIRALLARRGHVVHTAGTVAEARAVLGATPLDGVLVDIWLGGESGFEVQGWIDDHRPELNARLAFVTGDPVAPHDSATFGARLRRPVLGKPFDLDQLEGLVRSWERGCGEQGSGTTRAG